MTLTQFNIVDHSIIQYGVREPYITDLLFKYLQPGDIFLDIGANIGYDTLLACKIVGEGGKVFSIEPNSRIYAELEKNIALNKEILPIEHIQTFKVGAGKTKTTFESHYAEGNP
jgi:protein-L-isoaspartate O-methyltransferase